MGIESVLRTALNVYKKAVSKYKIKLKRTGGGKNIVKQPSEFQIRITDFIGAAYTKCIPGTEKCDTSEVLVQLKKDENASCSSWASSTTFLGLTDKAICSDILTKSDETDQKVIFKTT